MSKLEKEALQAADDFVKKMHKKFAKKAAAQKILPRKIGKIWIHDMSDVLQEYLDALKIWSPDHVGVQYIPVGTCLGNFIVLECREKHRHRYIGWFFVSEDKLGALNVGAWTYKGRKCGYYIHQVTSDDKPAGRVAVGITK